MGSLLYTKEADWAAHTYRTHGAPAFYTNKLVSLRVDPCRVAYFFWRVDCCACGCLDGAPHGSNVPHCIISSSYFSFIIVNQFPCITEHYSKLALRQTVIRESQGDRECVCVSVYQHVCAAMPAFNKVHRKVVPPCEVQLRGVFFNDVNVILVHFFLNCSTCLVPLPDPLYITATQRGISYTALTVWKWKKINPGELHCSQLGRKKVFIQDSKNTSVSSRR